MKKIKSINFFFSAFFCIVLSILFIIFNQSCSEKSISLQVSSKNILAKIKLNINTEEIKTYSGLKAIRSIGSKPFDDYEILINTSEIRCFIKNLHLSNLNNPIFVSIYSNKKIDDQILNSNNIDALSVFDLNEGKLVHHFFSKANESFNENFYYSVETNKITSNSIDFFLKNETQFKNSSENTIINLKSSNFQDFKLSRSKEILEIKIALMEKRIWKKLRAINANLLQDIAKHTCGCRCTEGAEANKGCYSGGGLGAWMCESNDDSHLCYERSGDCKLRSNNYDSLANVGFDTTLHYSFRDNFLSSSGFGSWYRSFYYALGVYLDSIPPLTLTIQTASFLGQFNQTISKLLNPSEFTSDSLLPFTMKEQLLNILNQYGNLNQDSTYQEIIGTVISDVNHFSGYTVGQFCEEVNSSN